jgi:hypothetical protein
VPWASEACTSVWDKTKKATVSEALVEYIQRRRQWKMIDIFGKIDIDPAYDYKRGGAPTQDSGLHHGPRLPKPRESYPAEAARGKRVELRAAGE